MVTTTRHRRALPPTGAWRGDVVYVVGSGPSALAADLAGINAAAAEGRARVIAVNHACHDLPDADLIYSKDIGLYRAQEGHPTCCHDLTQRSRSACVMSIGARGDLDAWRDALDDLVVIQEWPRSHPGQCGPWPASLDEPLVTCGNSGVGALCLADLLTDGDGEVHLVGLDMDRHPYTQWARWFDEGGYAFAVRARVVVHGDTALDPSGRWERVA